MSKTKTVILLLDAARVSGRGHLRGIAKYARVHGPWWFYMEPPYYIRHGRKKESTLRLKKLNADGVISHHPLENTEIAALNLPTVFTAPPHTRSDDDTIGKMAAEHLLERGFYNFAYCGYEDMFWSHERGVAFGRRINAAGFHTHFLKQPRANVKRSWENEPTLIADWLKSLPKPVGLMACNDECAEHVIEACRIAGLYVPEQVAVIGVDNDELVCELSAIPISSVEINFERQGFAVADLLDQLMKKRKVKSEIIIIQPTRIITRQSTDVLAIKDPEVGKAVRFIRENSRQPIQVDDVVNAAALSRCELYKRFRRTIGRSIHDEIKRARVEQVATMLTQSNMSVTEIAFAFGFNSAGNIGRYFKKQKGLSPLAYRKKFGHK